MDLALAITSYQRLSPNLVARYVFSAEREYSLGRSPDCDWHLPDPERVISSRHAQLCYRHGRFLLTDVSTNGVFLNDEVEPIGPGNSRPLADGDRLRLGDYQLAVLLESSDLAPVAAPKPFSDPLTETTAEPGSPAPSGTPAMFSAGGSQNSPGDRPIGDAIGINPALASGLADRRLGDSHVDIPAVEIPPVWDWRDDKPQHSPGREEGPGQIEALLEGLGMPELAGQPLPVEVFRGLGELTRALLEQLLDLLHWRAQQKQKLRVQQTLFQRTENNPLKFSATAQDAINALVLRRHSSFLDGDAAIAAAFADVRDHDRGLLAGLEAVVGEFIDDTCGPGKQRFGRAAFFSKARAWDALRERRIAQREEFGSTAQVLRSDIFIEAYENAVRDQE